MKIKISFAFTLLVLIIFIFFVQLIFPVNAEIARLPDNSGLRSDENILEFVAGLIRTVLGIVGAILLILIIYGGFTYATAAGSEEKVKKGRNILTYAIIGIVIIAVAWILSDYVIGQFLSGGNRNPANPASSSTNSADSNSDQDLTGDQTNSGDTSSSTQSNQPTNQGGLPPAGNTSSDEIPIDINIPSSVGP